MTDNDGHGRTLTSLTTSDTSTLIDYNIGLNDMFDDNSAASINSNRPSKPSKSVVPSSWPNTEETTAKKIKNN